MKLQNVYKSFGKKQVISDFSYDFPKKGIIFVDGESGAGKTTLLNIISGLLKPDSGEVQLETVSYLFQEDRLFEWTNVLDNVLCVNKNKDLCIKILTQLGLGEELYSVTNSLSGGMKRRVAIARTLAYDANIILFDEPFKGLDKNTLEKTIKSIKINTVNKLVLIISHETDKSYFEDYEIININ